MLPVWIIGAADTYKVDLMQVLVESSGVVQGVLLVLVLMSLVCWYIIGSKTLYFHRSFRNNREFQKLFFELRDLDKLFEFASTAQRCPLARVFREGYKEMSRIKAVGREEQSAALAMDNLERTLRKARQEELEKAEKMIQFLGTTGSTAPFIGLFGTVWGIVEAFDRIPKVQSGVILDKVAGPMAHALIATAVGLLAAIPGVMAYNWFVRKVRALLSEMDGFTSEFLNIVRRNFFH